LGIVEVFGKALSGIVGGSVDFAPLEEQTEGIQRPEVTGLLHEDGCAASGENLR
jgi:hypothetical protein